MAPARNTTQHTQSKIFPSALFTRLEVLTYVPDLYAKYVSERCKV